MKQLKFFGSIFLFAVFVMGCELGEKGAVPSILVTGQGRVEAVPDEAVTSFGVTTEEKTLGAAYQGNNKKMLAIINAVKQSGVPERDIQTSAFSVSPFYAVNERGIQIPGERAGYRVSQQVRVTLRDLSKAGELIDRVMAEGTNEFNGIQFQSSRAEALKKEAKAMAAKDAAENAGILAKSLGAGVGKLLRVTDETQQAYPMDHRPMMMMRAEAMGAPEINAGSLTVTASCTVEYAIAQ